MRAKQGAAKRPDGRAVVSPAPRQAPQANKSQGIAALVGKIEKLKASVPANVEHPFKVVKHQFGHVKVRYRRLKKNTAQSVTLFALSNLWMARGKLLAAQE